MKTDQKVVSNDSTSTRLSHHSPASKRHFLTANYLPLLSTTSKLHTGRLGYHSNPWIAFRRLPSRRVFPTVALTLRIWDAEHAPQERSDRDDFHQHRRITPATELLQKSFAPLSQAHPIFSLDNWTHHNRTETLTSTKRKVVPFYWQRMGRGCIPNDFLEKIRKTPPTSRTTNHDAGFPPLYVSHPKKGCEFLRNSADSHAKSLARSLTKKGLEILFNHQVLLIRGQTEAECNFTNFLVRKFRTSTGSLFFQTMFRVFSQIVGHSRSWKFFWGLDTKNTRYRRKAVESWYGRQNSRNRRHGHPVRIHGRERREDTETDGRRATRKWANDAAGPRVLFVRSRPRSYLVVTPSTPPAVADDDDRKMWKKLGNRFAFRLSSPPGPAPRRLEGANSTWTRITYAYIGVGASFWGLRVILQKSAHFNWILAHEKGIPASYVLITFCVLKYNLKCFAHLMEVRPKHRLLLTLVLRFSSPSSRRYQQSYFSYHPSWEIRHFES